MSVMGDMSHSPCVVFALDAEHGALNDWIREILQTSRGQGGGGLLAVYLGFGDANNKKVRLVGISLTQEQLLIEAELCRLQKETKDGLKLNFNMHRLADFTDIKDVGALFTLSEHQSLTFHRIKSIRVKEDHMEFLKQFCTAEDVIKGQCLVDLLTKSGVLVDSFPLHEERALLRLQAAWLNFESLDQPYDSIRAYFGEKVGIYFAFLGFYTYGLVIPVLVLLLFSLFSFKNVTIRIMFSICNLLWVMVFLKLWKRRCNALAYSWGTFQLTAIEEPRQEFKGRIDVNTITGRLEPVFPVLERLMIMFGRSIPIVSSCLAGGTFLMWLYFKTQLYVEEIEFRFFAVEMIAINIPTMIYCAVIFVLSNYYRKLARSLTDAENHRLQSQYENHLILKLIAFDFVNNFGCLFYVAFVLQDIERLHRYLVCFLITQQILQQFQEAIVPYFVSKHLKEKMESKLEEEEGSKLTDTPGGRAKVELAMDAYNDTFDDYQEMWLQFGYVFLFSTAFPWAAFWALFNNIIEIRTDALKLCTSFRRPIAQRVADIGAWQPAFELLGVIAITTNCALLALSQESQEVLYDWSSGSVVILFVGFEHLIFFLRSVVCWLIPDVPEHVQAAVDRVEFLSLQAYANEQSYNNKQRIGLDPPRSTSLNGIVV